MQKAFTLIELSIVLVIIGLILGGVLVGRDLVEAANIRAQITQIETLQTQINTYRLKYNCLPGDCINATQFGTADAAGNAVVNGDGNGIISSFTVSGVYTPYSGNCLSASIANEIPQLFLQLNIAGLSGYTTDGASSPVNIGYPKTSMGGFFVTCLSGGAAPHNSSLQTGNIMVMGVNQTSLAGRIQYSIGLTQYYHTGYNLPGVLKFTFEYARRIDNKIDDGLPDKGSFGVISRTVGGACALPSASSYANAPVDCFIAAGKKL